MTTNRLLDASKLVHTLHMCEQEGLASGMPTRDEWIDAVDNLGAAIAEAESAAVGHLKSQHVALKEIYPEMTRKERRQFITENVPKESKIADITTAKALVGELVEAIEDAKVWIKEMREGVDKWSNGDCGLDARCQNMEAWINSTATPALTKAQQWLDSVGE